MGVFQRLLTLTLLQKHRDTNERRIVIQICGVYATFCQDEGILLQKYRDRNGSCIAILFRSIGSGVDVTLPNISPANRFMKSRRVSNAALANAALVLSSQNWKKYSRWGAASKNKSKRPWVFCCRAGIDAALVRVQFVLRGCDHH